MFRIFVVVSVVAILLGCASGAKRLTVPEFSKIESGGVQSYDPARAKEPPKPGETNAPAAAKSVVLEPGIQFAVLVDEDPSLSKQYVVPANGIIEYPALGPMQVSGLTATELAKKIKDGLERDILRQATVTVTVAPTAMGVGVIWVMGAVGRPGPVGMPPDGRFTVMQAILTVVPSNFANLGKVRVIRYGRDGRKYETFVNVARVMAGHFEDDLTLQSGDYILVGEKIVNF